jgi:hypothetical protein
MNETQRVAGRDDIGDRAIDGRVPDVVKVRHVLSSGRSYVSQDAAREWCREHNLQINEIVKRGVKELVFATFGSRNLSSERYNLFKGMKTDTSGTVKCYAIDKKALSRKLGIPEDTPQVMPPPPPSNVVPLR